MGVLNDIKTDFDSGVAKTFGEHYDHLMAMAMLLCKGDTFVAEDLVMRTFLQFFRKKDKFDASKGTLGAWLTGLMKGVYHDLNRGKMQAAVVYISPDELDSVAVERADSSGDEALLAASDAEAVNEAIQALSKPLREIIILRYFDELSVPEIARRLCTSTDSVYARLYYARKILGRRLSKVMKRAAPALVALLLVAGALFAGVLGGWFKGLFGDSAASEGGNAGAHAPQAEVFNSSEAPPARETPANAEPQDEGSVSAGASGGSDVSSSADSEPAGDEVGYSVFTAGSEPALQSGFTRAEDWSGGVLSDRVDYLIRGNDRMRTPEGVGEAHFPGRSLTLDGGRVLCKGADGSVIRFDDLRLYGCNIANGNGGNRQELCGTFTVYGDAADSPSVLAVSNESGTREFGLHARLIGSADAVITVCGQGNETASRGTFGAVEVCDDADAADFDGRWVVNGSDKTSIQLRARSMSALGLKQSSAQPFVTLAGHGELVATDSLDLAGATLAVHGEGTIKVPGSGTVSFADGAVISGVGEGAALVVDAPLSDVVVDCDAPGLGTLRIAAAKSVSVGRHFVAPDAALVILSAESYSADPAARYKSLDASGVRGIVRETLANDETGFTDAGGWDSGEAPSFANDYVIPYGKLLRVTTEGAVFQGHSLTIERGGDFAVKDVEATVGDLRMQGGGRISVRGDGVRNRLFGAGTVSCTSMTDHSQAFTIDIEVENGPRWFDFAVSLSGDGLIMPRWYNGQEGRSWPESRITVSGDNSAYTGAWFLCNGNVRTVFASSSAVGSAEAFMNNRIQFRWGGRLYAPENLEIPASAGMQVRWDPNPSNSEGVLEVEEGRCLVVGSPICGNGSFRKDGKGDLVFAAPTSSFNEEHSRIVLGEGRVIVRNPAALDIAGGRVVVDTSLAAGSGNCLRIECDAPLAMWPSGIRQSSGAAMPLRLESPALEGDSSARNVDLLRFVGGAETTALVLGGESPDIVLASRHKGWRAELKQRTSGPDLVVYAESHPACFVIRLR